MVFHYQLASDIIDQYDSQLEAFPEGSLKRELADELIDLVQSEYFAGALYELLTATYESTVSQFLSDTLTKHMKTTPRKRSSAFLQVPENQMQGQNNSAGQKPGSVVQDEPHIAVVQLTTIFYQLQNSDLITEKLSMDIKKTLWIEPKTEEIKLQIPETSSNQGSNSGSVLRKKNDFAAYDSQLGQLLKLVFFESQEAQRIPMEEFMQDLAPFEQMQAQQSMGSIFGGGDANDIMRQLSADVGDEYGSEMQMLQKLMSLSGK